MRILALKQNPDHPVSVLIRAMIKSGAMANGDRLAKNYAGFNPWDDPQYISFDALVQNNNPVSFGALQSRACFPERAFRANTRHYLFPRFRTKAFSRKKIGFDEGGHLFGGALIRHHIQLAKDLNARCVFVSRDRGRRSFNFFMQNRVNAQLDDKSLHLTQLQGYKFNTCGLTNVESCWQYIAAASFTDEPPLQIMQEMPFRIEPKSFPQDHKTSDRPVGLQLKE